MQRAACEATIADRFLALLPSATNIHTANIGGLHGVRFNCSIADGSYQVRHECFNAFNGGRILNTGVLCSKCGQHYPVELEDLTSLDS